LNTKAMTTTTTLRKPARGASQYVQTQMRSSTPLELVVLLCNAALRSAATAREAMVKRDIRTRRAALSRMLAIIAELQKTLDIEKGGKIARDLDRLYAWVTSRLIDATAQETVRPIDDAVRVLEPLRDAWQSVAAGSRHDATP
jgi:flagellar secretion chaperone FliS